MATVRFSYPLIKDLTRIPDLRDARSVYHFDCLIAAQIPQGRQFVRRCLSCDLPNGQFEKLSENERLVFLIMSEFERGFLLKRVVTCSIEKTIPHCVHTLIEQGRIGQCVSVSGELRTLYSFTESKLKVAYPTGLVTIPL
jgi:hypothetical protein